MRKLFLLLAATMLFTTTFAFSVVSSFQKKASDVYIPIGATGLRISLQNLSTIDVKDFEKLSGHHLNFIDRFGFKLAQRKLRNSIAADGTIDSKKLNKFLEEGDHSAGFHVGGFALGFLLGLIGVLLAYVIGGDPEVKRNRAKWAWIGFGLITAIEVILILVTLSSLARK